MNSTVTSHEKYRLDYQAPHYWIDTIDLDVHLDDHQTRVVAISRVRRNGQHNEPLLLDGEGLTLTGVALDGVACSRYQRLPGQLSIPDVPAEFV